VFNRPEINGVLPGVLYEEERIIWGSLITSGDSILSSGQETYAGTLVVWVPEDAAGTFTINFSYGCCTDLGAEPDSMYVRPLGRVPAKITVEIGQCCFGLGSGHYGCLDQVTVSQCPDAGLCHGLCSEDGTTPCVSDSDCTGTCSGVCAGTLANCWDDTDCPVGTCSHDASACHTDLECASTCTISGDPCNSHWDCDWGICSTWDYYCVSDDDCPQTGAECSTAAGGLDPELCSGTFGECNGGEHCIPDVAGEVCHPDLDMLCPGDQQCLVQGDYLFFPGRDCSVSCGFCTNPGPNDPYCADGDACTIDVCLEDLTCDHTPVAIGPNECCDYIPDSTEDDLAGAGSIVSKYVGQEQCRDNVCTPGNGCVLEDTGQCGVPHHPLSPSGTACDDFENCTYNDVCNGEYPPTCAGSDVGLLECTQSQNCVDLTGTTSECVEGFCHCVPEALYPKSRYISLMPQDLGTQSAMRVTFVDLPAPFDTWNGVSMWAGPPAVYCENSGQATPPHGGCGPSPSHAPTFLASTLQCQPYYADWDTLEALHIYHEGIVPSSTYEVQAIEIGLDIYDQGNYTEPVELTTSGWSDVIEDCATQPCGPPDGVVRMTSDVTGFVNKFKNLPVAVMQTRTDLVSAENGPIPDQKTTVIEFVHAVDAFGGDPYPFSPGPLPCP
jgi:hypothetical protein